MLYTAFISLDALWLGVVARSFYLSELGSSMRMLEGVFSPRYGAAAIVYALLVLGVIFFVLPDARSVTNVLLRGGLLGLVTYGVYDATNRAILSHWPLGISFFDVAWGVVVCALVSAIGFFVQTRWLS